MKFVETQTEDNICYTCCKNLTKKGLLRNTDIQKRSNSRPVVS